MGGRRRLGGPHGGVAGGATLVLHQVGERSYTTAGFTEGDVLVFGRESQGLPPEIVEGRRERCLRIPTRPEVRSLNLSNSVAVAMYEAVRQWDG